MKPVSVAFIFLTPLLLNLPAKAQNFEKIWFDKNDSTYGYYTVVKPLSGRIQGTVVLLDGFSGNASGLLTETKIHTIACSNDMLTVCIPTGFRLYADKTIIELINTILKQIIQTYHLKKEQFAVGGFSSGGTIVLRYAELCKEYPADYPIQPAAVFTGDSPVDVLGLYQSSQRDIKKNFSGWWLGESSMIIDMLDKGIGKPDHNADNYRKISPFLQTDSSAGNEKWLKDVPYRTYHDVDINWHIQNRKRSFYETNMLNASELVTRLQLIGNTQAEFIASKIPGRRNNGERHPHVWAIIDEIDLVQWIREKLHFFPDHLVKPYSYKAPAGWEPEIIMFPIDFAPKLPYEGFEELRFAPGWGNESSNEKWAYTILWWLNNKYAFNELTLQENLESYFSGLTKRRAVADKLDMSAYFPARAQVQRIKTATNDLATYTAVVNIFDAQVTRKPGSLYIKAHVKKCTDTSKTVLIFEISGNAFTNGVWQQLDKINDDFNCVAN